MDHVQGFDRSQEILFLLDMTLLGFVHAEIKTTGRPPYNPAGLLKLYIVTIIYYAYRYPFTTAVGKMPPRFAGRQDEKHSFSLSLKSLTQGNPRNLAFVGDYGTGKMVLLKEFSNMAKNVFYVMFPCYKFDNSAQFFNFLIDTMNRKIRESKSEKVVSIFKNNIKGFSVPIIGGGIEFKEDDPAFDPMNRMISMFEAVYKAVNQPTILFFDDFQYYLKTIGHSEIIKQAFTVLTQ